jgi:hypothetical protein
MKITKFECEQLNNLISKLKISTVSNTNRVVIIKDKIELSRIVQDIETFKKVTADSLKPDNFEVLILSEDEEVKNVIQKLEQQFNEILIQELNSVIDVEIDMIDIEDYFKIVEENKNLDVLEYEDIFNKLVKKD